jgi:hypothetical protein
MASNPAATRGLRDEGLLPHSRTAWQEYRIEADKYRELDDGGVLVLAHVIVHGKTSGVDVGQEVGQIRLDGAGLFQIRCSKVTTLVSYNDVERVLADLGLAGLAMSQENLRGLGPWRLYRVGAPEIEHVIADGPTPTSRTGPAAVVEGMRDFLGTWEDFRFGVDECRRLDDERVLVLAHFSGRRKTIGVEIGQV